MKQNITTTNRKAYTLAEFARMFGRHRSWAYRQVREKKIRTITGYGAELVPVHEIDRILGVVQQTTENQKP